MKGTRVLGYSAIAALGLVSALVAAGCGGPSTGAGRAAETFSPTVRSTSVPAEINPMLGVRTYAAGQHVAYAVERDGKTQVYVDGQPVARPYDGCTLVEFDSLGRHFYFGGKVGPRWYLIRDGTETTELGSLTSLDRIGVGGDSDASSEPSRYFLSIRIPQLSIWFARDSESYFALAYQNQTGRVLRDGAWLPLKYDSFYHKAMAISSDGSHVVLGVTSSDTGQAGIYLDGKRIAQGRADFAAFLSPNSRVVYRVAPENDDTGSVFDGENRLLGYEAVLPGVVTSPDMSRLAAVSTKHPGKQAVIVGGVEESAFDEVLWENRTQVSSFVWNRLGTSHAYVVRDGKQMRVVHDGKALDPHEEIAVGRLAISDDGKHLAYGVMESGKYAVVADGKMQERYAWIGRMVWDATGSRLYYPAKRADGWIVKGLDNGRSFTDIGWMRASPGGVVFAGKSGDGTWQVYVNGRSVSSSYEVVHDLAVDGHGVVRFAGRTNSSVDWVVTR